MVETVAAHYAWAEADVEQGQVEATGQGWRYSSSLVGDCAATQSAKRQDADTMESSMSRRSFLARPPRAVDDR